MIKLLLIILTLTITSFANQHKKITLQLNWLHQFQFAGYYIAKEKGFYKEVGLDVKIKEYSQDIDAIDDIVKNKAQFAVGRSSLLIDKIKGANIIALGAIYQESPLMLLVKKDSNINSVKDLKNKKIMITKDARFSASILAMLSSNGLNKDDFIVQKHSFNIDDLISGKTDAMSSYISNEPIILKEKNIEYKIFNPKDFGFHFYNDILFTSSDFIKNRSKTTEDFYNASIKGWQYAFDNIAESAEIIYKKYNTQNKSLIHLVKEGEILKKLAYANNEGLGHLSKNKLEKIVNVFKIFGLVNNEIEINDFIYDKNPHKTMTFEISYQLQKIILLFVILIILFIAIIIYFIRRNHQIKSLLHSVINSTDDLIFYKDNKLKYIGCNSSFESVLNRTESEILGKTDFSFFPKELALRFKEEDLKVLKNKTVFIKNEWFTINNKEVLFQTKMMPLKYKKGALGLLCISRDITNLYEIQEKLKVQAYYDELTHVYNRKAFNERIEEKFDLFFRYETIFSICMFDIDDFKHINDTFGHDIGDLVLANLAKEIKQIIRKSDLLFRVGGEEFIIIFPKISSEDAFIIAEKIRLFIAKTNLFDNEMITISLGLTQVKKDDTINSLYTRVDKLMYKSKRNGKNQTNKD